MTPDGAQATFTAQASVGLTTEADLPALLADRATGPTVCGDAHGIGLSHGDRSSPGERLCKTHAGKMQTEIRQAITERRLVQFTLHGLRRVAEVHLYGVHRGVSQLLVYQVGGQSKSGGLPHWRRVDLSEMHDLVLLADASAERRLETRPPDWDEILIIAE